MTENSVSSPQKLQFISYPKSGRSWIRYALTCLGVDDEIKFHHDNFEYIKAAKPEHDFSLDSRRKKYSATRPIVYLSRDPRDIMVSHYFQITGRFGPVFNYNGDLSDFIRDPYFGAQSLKCFRNMWTDLCNDGYALHVTYEEFHSDFVSTLRRVVNHYGFNISDEQLEKSESDASFESMKGVEQSGRFPKNWLRPKNGYPKVRKGQVGSYVTELTAQDIEYLDNIFGEPAQQQFQQKVQQQC